MAYSIDKYNGTTIAVVEDGTIDSTLDIKLIGKNYAGYGEVQNENFLHMLENFAGNNAPPRPISGQIWYDTSVRKLKFYDASTARWKTTGGAEVSSTVPAGLAIGDFWYDSTNKQVYIYDGSTYILVGPQGVAGLGTTEMKSRIVTDAATGAQHGIIQAFVDGEVMFIISTDSFTLSVASAIPGFGYITQGITLVNSDNTDGITDGDPLDPLNPGRSFWGTATNAMKLNGLTSDQFVQIGSGGIEFDSIVRFADVGYTLGDDNDLEVKIDTDGSTPIIGTTLTGTLKFKTLTNTPLVLVNENILPGLANTTDLGTTLVPFKNIYAANLYGTASKTDRLKIDNTATDDASAYKSAKTTAAPDTIAARDGSGRLTASAFLGNATSATTATTASQANSLEVGSGVYRTASVDTPDSGTPNTVAVRTVDGDLCATIFRGTATAALFADLAEKYLADDEYEIGTVVCVGGEAEVTACNLGDRAFGAVSGSPAYMMNAGLEGGTYIALKGRVPVKVIGPVRKGDKLVAAGTGCAGVAHVVLKNLAIKAGNFPDTFAIALENSDEDGIKLIEAIIL